jgi:hypothetical protein
MEAATEGLAVPEAYIQFLLRNFVSQKGGFVPFVFSHSHMEREVRS